MVYPLSHKEGVEYIDSDWCRHIGDWWSSELMKWSFDCSECSKHSSGEKIKSLCSKNRS